VRQPQLPIRLVERGDACSRASYGAILVLVFQLWGANIDVFARAIQLVGLLITGQGFENLRDLLAELDHRPAVRS
jgi:hypothetical protein